MAHFIDEDNHNVIEYFKRFFLFEGLKVTLKSFGRKFQTVQKDLQGTRTGMEQGAQRGVLDSGDTL